MLESTEHGVVSVGGIFATDAVSIRDNATIDAGTVAVPDFDQGVVHGLTGCHIDDLSVEDKLNALLAISDIGADILSSDIVRAFGYIWA